jgi:hypothetical protein
MKANDSVECQRCPRLTPDASGGPNSACRPARAAEPRARRARPPRLATGWVAILRALAYSSGDSPYRKHGGHGNEFTARALCALLR